MNTHPYFKANLNIILKVESYCYNFTTFFCYSSASLQISGGEDVPGYGSLTKRVLCRGYMPRAATALSFPLTISVRQAQGRLQSL